MQQDEVRQPWIPMELRAEGSVADIVKGGGGKLSVVGGDPGDNRKPTGQG